jgi:hypothetical protein
LRRISRRSSRPPRTNLSFANSQRSGSTLWNPYTTNSPCLILFKFCWEG